MSEDRIRLRLHWGGNFQPLLGSQCQWRYVGGEVFNESVPANSLYADLCLKLNDKVGYTTSIKYQAPGEDLVPDELVSITGDDDLQELYDEYMNAMRRPGTPVKTFRVKMFLFPALQTELDTQARPEELQPFDPDEWCEPEDLADDEAALGDEAILCLQGNPMDKCWYDVQEPDASSTDPSCAPSDMQWDQQPALAVVPSLNHAAANFAPAPTFMGRPAEQGEGEGLFGARQAGAGQLLQGLDQFAFGNLLQSISRSTVMQHPMGITEEMDLLDPYHERDDGAAGHAATAQQQKYPRLNQPARPGAVDGAPVQAGLERRPEGLVWGMGSSVLQEADDPDAAHLTALVRIQDNLAPKIVRYASLVGNLPSHISIFGSDGGRALSGGCDAAGPSSRMEGGNGSGGVEQAAGAALGAGEAAGNGRQYELPSHISIFGSSNRELDDAEVAELARLRRMRPNVTDSLGSGANDSKCITQEFSRDGSPVQGNGHDLADFAPELCVDAGAAAAGGADSPPVSTPKLLEEVVQVPVHEVQIIRKIGEGAFGEVSLANVSSHGLVAVKWLKKDRFAKYSESFMREAEVLAKLNHPNIIRMYGVVMEPVERGAHVGSTFMESSSSSSSSRERGREWNREGGPGNPADQHYIIAGIMTDFVRGGSLSGQLRAAKRRPTLKERCQVAVQAARGMAFLHAQNPAVIHFDLKPDNLLVDGDGETLHVKVADFGLSKHKFQTFVSCRDLRGTLPYMAPELVSSPHQVSERCDVWSMGVVMWEMYMLEVPYNDLTAHQILTALMHGNIHLHVPSSCEPEWRGLIEMCMDPRPETRPSFKQLTIILDKMLRQL